MDVYSHIIDDDRRRNAEMFEDAFYGKQDLDPQLRKGESGENIMTVPEGVDAELLAKFCQIRKWQHCLLHWQRR